MRLATWNVNSVKARLPRLLQWLADMGMRIDLVYVTEAVAARVRSAYVDREARKGKGPSDHAPVVVDLS